MTESIARLALFTLLPVLLGAAIVVFDRTAKGPVRRAEAFLVPLFLIGVGGSGLAGFIAHVFVSGGEGDPFQREVGFASLAIGLLGAVAAERRDGFREATVAAAVVLGLGALLAQVMESTAGGLALGKALLDAAHLAGPVLLIWFLVTLRRAERVEPPTIVLRSWMIPIRSGSIAAVAIAATAFSVGHSTGQVMGLSLAGVAAAGVAFWWIVSRAPSHRAGSVT